MKTHIQYLVVAAAALSACATVGQAPPEVPVQAPRAVDALGPGDVVEVRVFREKDLEGRYRVSDDGTIDFPLIGSVRLVGQSPEQVSEVIRGRLADGYLVDPQVSVFVAERKSQNVHVLGQVNKPGSFGYESGMSIVQAITNVGGFTKLASKNRVTVTRIDPTGKKVTFNVKVADIGSGRAANFQLSPGDIIFVPEALF
jgi:protein involved in polysaccharide export with SLBB domain